MNTQTATEVDAGPIATLEDLYDPKFREMVRENDPDALAMLGLTDDDMPEVRVVTDRDDTLHISLPRELPDNLTVADLESISAAGKPNWAAANAYLNSGGQLFFPGMHDRISHPQSENRGG